MKPAQTTSEAIEIIDNAIELLQGVRQDLQAQLLADQRAAQRRRLDLIVIDDKTKN
jgi:hypothetical protein